MAEEVQTTDLEKTENFLQPPEIEDTLNGYILSNSFIPEEVLIEILSYIPIEQLLELSLVCKCWCKLIRSSQIWSQICKRTYGQAPKKNPWYVLYAVLSNRLFYDVLSCSSHEDSGSQICQTAKQAEFIILDHPRKKKRSRTDTVHPFTRNSLGCTYYVFNGTTSSVLDFYKTRCGFGSSKYSPFMYYVNADKLLLYIRSTHHI